MKIGIISINTHTKALNFACPLHTYAFQQFLSDHGIESTVIDYMPIYNNKEYDPSILCIFICNMATTKL